MVPSGFTVRAPRAEDAEGVADLHRACDVVIFGEPDTDVMDVRDEWALPGFDPARDAWLLHASDGTLRAYGSLRARAEGRDYDGDLRVLPGDSISALAPPLLAMIEARVGERAPSGSALCFFTAEIEGEMRAMLQGAGYEDARTFFRMRIDLSPISRERPSLPQGIEIRPIRLGEDDRAIHAVLEDAFAEHFRHTPQSFGAWWAARSRHERFAPSLFFLAWDGDRVAGGLTAYDHGDIGFVRELGVRPAWRGRGIGSALLQRSFELFRARGQLRVALGVDAENESAIGLYERLGMRVDSRHNLLRRRLDP
jgi:ribosomal protein S18 acetylase RimI-like enzyme